MSTITNLDIGPVKFITTSSKDALTSLAAIQSNGSLHTLTLDDVANISEFLATAWENISGEEYGPVVISERGYVSVEGVSITGSDCE